MDATPAQTRASFNATVGRNLRGLREAVGMSQTALATVLGRAGLPFTQQAVNKIEHGLRSLRVEEAAVMADLFGVPTVALMTLNESRARAFQEALGWRVAEQRCIAKETDLRRELEGVQAAIVAARRKRLLAEAEVNSLGDEGDDDARIVTGTRLPRRPLESTDYRDPTSSERQQGKRLPRAAEVTGIEPQLEFARGESA